MNAALTAQPKLNSNSNKEKSFLMTYKKPLNSNYKCFLKNRYNNFCKKENPLKYLKYNNFEPDIINLQIKFIPKNNAKNIPNALENSEILNKINKLRLKNRRLNHNHLIEKLKVFTNSSIKTSYSISYRIMNKLNQILKKENKSKPFLNKRNPFNQKSKSIDMSCDKRNQRNLSIQNQNNESNNNSHLKTKSALSRYITKANSKLIEFSLTIPQTGNCKSQNKKIMITSRQNRKSYIKEIPPIITTYGCMFNNKSQEFRFYKLIKDLRKVQVQLKEKPELKSKIFHKLNLLITNCCVNKYKHQDIEELIEDIIKMKNSSQIQQNKIIKDYLANCIQFTSKKLNKRKKLNINKNFSLDMTPLNQFIKKNNNFADENKNRMLNLNESCSLDYTKTKGSGLN